MKHAPTPWMFDTGDDGAVLYNDDGTIANIPIDLLAYKANAAFIVKACNAHEELLEAAKQADALILSRISSPEVGNVLDALNKAIAKAEES